MDETSPTPAPALATIRDIGSYDGQRVRLRGWLYNLRESGKLLFPILRDGTGWIQGVVFKKNVPAELFDALKGLPQESSLEVVGQVRADARAPGGFELDIQEATILQAVDPARPYPITPKEHGIEFLMEHRHLWLRSQRQAAILRVRHEIIKAVRDFFDGDGFVLGDAPILTPAACEGTSNLFEVEYFDQKAYLTQSRPALRRGGGDGGGQDLLLRPDLPRREEQDAPPPHRVLDGRARGGLRHPRRRHASGRKAGRLRGGPRAGEAPPRAGAAGARRRPSWRRSSCPSRG